MFIRRSTTVKYFVAAFLGAAIYCEWFIYLVQPQYWPALKCADHDSTCTKILFIADPQIQGDLAIPPPLSYIVNWDSDRYLKSTFKVVVNHFKPDVLVYLGDLMDEGSISTLVQFHSYVKRLASIFEVDYEVMQVWVPGDNDIGGENEPIRRDKIAEFEKVFQQPDILHYRNISFYKVNAITNTFPQKIDSESTEKNFKIVVSHYPVTQRHQFGSQVYNTIHPNIFFCAHEHESKYVTQSKELTHRRTTWFSDPGLILNLNFKEEDLLHEVYVPTCSYRMGTNYIGYGAAVLDNNNEYMRYAVFWSSTRFPYLILYLVILIILLLYCLVFCAARLLHRQAKKPMTADMSPLLERM